MEKKKKKRIADYDTTGNLGVTEMFGAIFFMLIGGVKKSYNYYHQVKYQKRNIWVGYVLKIVFLLIGISLFLYFTNN